MFLNKLELLLKEYLIKACKLHHSLTRKDVKKLAYQLAMKNALKIPAYQSVNQKIPAVQGLRHSMNQMLMNFLTTYRMFTKDFLVWRHLTSKI